LKLFSLRNTIKGEDTYRWTGLNRAAACNGSLLDDGGDLSNLSRKLLTQLQYPYHFLVNSKEIAGQVMVGRGLQNEILHAFYRSCPKPEACL